MLAEVKPEVKLKAAEAEHPLDKQLKAYQERLQPQVAVSQGNIVASNGSKENVRPTNHTTEAEEDVIANFGWVQIEEIPPIPYIERGDRHFVANKIVAEILYKRIEEYFSKEILFCLALIMVRMTKKEADTFNSINREHCDMGLVGSYCFKENDFMIELKDVRKYIEFYIACRNLVFYKQKENSLFGFIEIEGKTQVPFLLEGEQKLVPLFYFDGQGEYLDQRTSDLTDPFKIAYIKFCCKIQKINKNYYEKTPLKVVDFEDAKKCFPTEIKFEVQLPNSVNEDLFAPEVRVAYLHSNEGRVPMPLYSSETNSLRNGPSEPENRTLQVENCESNVSLYHSRLNNLEIRQDQLERNIKDIRPIQDSRKVSEKSRNKRNAKNIGQIEAKEPKIAKTTATNSRLQEQSSCSNSEKTLHHLHGVQINKQLPKGLITPVYPGSTNQQNRPERPQRSSKVTPISTTSNRNMRILPNTHLRDNYPSRDNNISESSVVSPITPLLSKSLTNVPYKSPSGASSPGLPQVDPYLNDVSQQISRYSLSSHTPSRTMQETIISHQPETAMQSTRNCYRPEGPIKQFPLSSSNISHRPKTNLYQHPPNYQHNNIPPSKAMPNPGQNRPVNLSSPGDFGINYYQETLAQNSYAPNYCQQAPGEIAFSQIYLNPPQFRNNLHTSWMEFQMAQCFQKAQQQMSQKSYHPAMTTLSQNIQNHQILAPSSYYQQYNNSTVPAAQTINISSTNITFSQPIRQNYFPIPVKITTTVNSFKNPDANNNETGKPSADFHLTVLEHPSFMDKDSELYVVENCPIDDKKLLGISTSPVCKVFLVNFSEFVEKVLGFNPFTIRTLSHEFKLCLHGLNEIQKLRFYREAKVLGLEFVGHFKEVFVKYDELLQCYELYKQNRLTLKQQWSR